MDPRRSGQDVLRCTLCKASETSRHCEVCHMNLCVDCIEKHLSDKTSFHNVIPFQEYLSTFQYPYCSHHPTKKCELLCEQCNIPICASCISCGQHLGHKALDILEELESKRKQIKKDLHELDKIIYPDYIDAVSSVHSQKANMEEKSEKLAEIVNKQGEIWRNEIDSIVQEMQSKINDINCQYQTVIDKQEADINQTMNAISQVIQNLRELLDTANVYCVFEYKTKNDQFRKLPPKVKISLLDFVPKKFDREKIMEQFGALSSLTDYEFIMPSQGTETPPPDRPLMEVPQLLTEITTGCKYLQSVSCLSEEEIWTHANDNIMMLRNLEGELVKSVQSRSKGKVWDLAVTRNGDLVYTDNTDKSINVVKNKKIKALIKLQGWIPFYVCCTSFDGVLVSMITDDYQQKKFCVTLAQQRRKTFSGMTKAGHYIHPSHTINTQVKTKTEISAWLTMSLVQ